MSVSTQSVNIPHPLAALSARDLVVMTFIVGLGISRLRWPVPGGDDLSALRSELRRREVA